MVDSFADLLKLLSSLQELKYVKYIYLCVCGGGRGKEGWGGWVREDVGQEEFYIVYTSYHIFSKSHP